MNDRSRNSCAAVRYGAGGRGRAQRQVPSARGAWALAALFWLALSGVLAAQDARIDDAYALMDREDWAAAQALAAAAFDEAADTDARLDAQGALATLRYYTGTPEEAVGAAQAWDDALVAAYGITEYTRLQALELLALSHSETGDAEAMHPIAVRRAFLAKYHADPETLIAALGDLIFASSALQDYDSMALFASDLYAAAPEGGAGAGDLMTEALWLRAHAHLKTENLVLSLAVARAVPDVPLSPLAAELQTAWIAAVEPRLTPRIEAAAAGLAFDPQQAGIAAQFHRFHDAVDRRDWPGAEAAAAPLLEAALPGDSYPVGLCLALALGVFEAGADAAQPWASCLSRFPAPVLAAAADVSPLLEAVAEGVFEQTGRFAEGPLRRRALEVSALLHGPFSEPTQRERLGLIQDMMYLHEDAEAARLIDRGLSDLSATTPATHADFLSLRGVMARREGALDVAERAFLEAADVLRSAGLLQSLRWTELLLQSAGLQSELGHHQEAARLAQRALEQQIARHGAESLEVAGARLILGSAHRGAGDIAAALPQLEAANALILRLQEGDAGLVLAAGMTLAAVLREAGETTRAEALLSRLAPRFEANPALLSDPQQAIVFYRLLARQAWEAGEMDKADGYALQVLAALRPTDPLRADALGLRGRIALAQARAVDAVRIYREISSEMRKPGRDRLAQARKALPLYIEAALGAAETAQGAPKRAFIDEALGAAQQLSALTAGAAIARAAARWETRPDLARLIRSIQDREADIVALNTRYTRALARGEAAADISTALAASSSEHQALRDRLEADFPDYVSTTEPRPVALAEMATLLGPEEILLVYATSDESAAGGYVNSNVFAITRDRVMTASLDRRARLLGLAERLRCQAALTDRSCATAVRGTRGAIDFEALTSPAGPRAPLFDLSLAHEGYMALLHPVAEMLSGKSTVIIAPDAALLGVPFHTLIKTAPGPATRIRTADWLIRDTAIFVVPTVANLAALRADRNSVRAPTEGFLGIGDPLIGAQSRGPLPYDCNVTSQRGMQVAGLSDGPGTRGALNNPNALRALSALPDTRCELRAAARYFGPGSQLLLHGAATEKAIRRLNATGALARFRTISFATHGLIAGEVGALDAGIVLTPPAQGDPSDDGLLTTGDIAELRLNAEMIMLSACNTAAGSGESDEGLSGLASAFFYAGARSLLVSHWPVYSDAATRLTTTMLGRRQSDPSIGYAEALRLSMLDVLDDPASDARSLHPAYWAPFMVVGEGAQKR